MRIAEVEAMLGVTQPDESAEMAQMKAKLAKVEAERAAEEEARREEEFKSQRAKEEYDKEVSAALKEMEDAPKTATRTGDDLVDRVLENPSVKLKTEDSIAVLSRCVEMGAKELKKIPRGGSAVAVLGNTGAGKSTYLNYVHGCRMVSLERVDLGLGGSGSVVRVSSLSPRKEIFTIGHENVSQTFIPGVAASDELGENWALIDCPGFLDNRGPEINIANAINIKQALSHFEKVHIVVLINFGSLKLDRGRGIREMLKIMSDLFGDKQRLTKSLDSIAVGVSQAPMKSESGKSITLLQVTEDLCNTKGFDEDTAEILRGLQKRAFAFHPLDECVEWPKRHDVIATINSLKPITKPAEVFKTVLSLDDEAMLRRVTDEMGKQALCKLKAKEYATADEVLQKLEKMSVIDSPIATRMVMHVKKELFSLVLEVAQEATRSSLFDQFMKADELINDVDQACAALRTMDEIDLQRLHKAKDEAVDFRKAREQQVKEMKEMQAAATDAKANRQAMEKQLEQLRLDREQTREMLHKLERERDEAQQQLLQQQEELKKEFEEQKAKIAKELTSANEKERTLLQEQQATLQKDLDDKLQAAERRAESQRKQNEGMVKSLKLDRDAREKQLIEDLEQLKQRELQQGVALERMRKEQELRSAIANRAMIAEALAAAKAEPAIKDTELLKQAEREAAAAFFQKVGTSEAQVRTATRIDWSGKGLDADDAKVIAYLLAEVMASLNRLDLDNNNIGDQGAIALGKALEVNASLKSLFLGSNYGGNNIGDQGAIAIAEALKVNASLKELNLIGNSIGSSGATAIAEALKVNASLKTLVLGGFYGGNNIGDQGAIAFAEALRVNASLNKLDLGYNSIGPSGATAIAEALKVNASLKELYLSQNQMGDAGAIAIADALRVNASMTELSLGLNNIGEAGKAKLREVAATRQNLEISL